MSKKNYLAYSKIVQQRAISLLNKLDSEIKLEAVLLYNAVKKWREVDLTSINLSFKNVQFDCVPPDVNAAHPTTQYSAVFIPIYGFNVARYRLGHGNAWYDTFLAKQQNAIRIGIGYELSIIDFENDPHDIDMDIIITESRIIL